MSRSLLGISFVLSAAVALGGEPATAPPPRVIRLAELVKHLGHADGETREAATKRLGEMALDPPPEVLAATKSDDPDVRRRATEIVQAMRGNVVAARLPRGERFAEQGRVDLFVAASAAWDLKPDDPRLWEPAMRLGQRLMEKTGRKGERKILNYPSRFEDFAAYKKSRSPRLTRVDDFYICPDPALMTPPVRYFNEAIHAAGVSSPKGIFNAIIVSRGGVETEAAIQNSVILANGDVTAVTGLYNVVIVCDGDVNLTKDGTSMAVIVARGNITINGSATRADLIAGGKVSLGKKYPPGGDSWYNVVKENEPNPLGITFFELSTVGVEVKIVDKTVRVGALAPGKACDKAGAKVGDSVLEVNGNKPTDAESLRRLLRDALAVGDATVKLNRGGKTEVVKVALPQ